MKTLPITILLIMLLGLATYGAIHAGLDRVVELRAVASALDMQRSECSDQQQATYLVRKQGKKNTPPGLPKRNLEIRKASEQQVRSHEDNPIIFHTKLNLAQMGSTSVEGKLYREVAEALLDRLYADYRPYQRMPGAAGELLTRALEAAKEKKEMSLPEHLATLEMGSMQSLWQGLLRGDGCPCLLDFLCYKTGQNRTPKINIAWCPRDLLAVLFDNDEKADSLIELQRAMALAGLQDTGDDDRVFQEHVSNLRDRYRDTADIKNSKNKRILVADF
ncbi:MAG: hypothetical protein AB7M93_26015 [Candidatus Obscuribacterales bacterium]